MGVLRLSVSVKPGPLPHDDDGRGTNAAGFFAGSSAGSHDPRAGVAPGVHLVGLKVLDARSARHVHDVIGVPDRAIDNARVTGRSAGASVTETTARAATTGAGL